MEGNDINLINKSEDEVYDAYADIANDIEVQKMIWKETNNLSEASEVYDEYLSKNNDNNGDKYE